MNHLCMNFKRFLKSIKTMVRYVLRLDLYAIWEKYKESYYYEWFKKSSVFRYAGHSRWKWSR